MRSPRTRVSVLVLLVLGIAAVPSAATAARIEAVEGKSYRISPRHGPWMIFVASLQGESAPQASAALVYELRRIGIPAYTFSQRGLKSRVDTKDRAGRQSRRSYTARAGGRMGNKGSETALAALELVGTLRTLADDSPADGDKIGDETDAGTGDGEPEDEDEEGSRAREATTPPRRRLAREAALQALFQIDLNPDIDPLAITEFLDDELANPSLRSFAGRIVEGVHSHLEELDGQLEQQAENWTVARMAATDRNVLRLAAFELLHSDVPFRVVIDEAVELAKRFGDARSPGFVNGVLDALVPVELRISATAPV